MRVSNSQDMLSMLEAVTNNFPGLVFWKDDQLRFLGCNQQMASAGGLNSNRRICGLTDYDMPWGLYAEDYRADDSKVLQGQVIERTEPFLNADGTHSIVQVLKKPLLTPQEGAIIGVTGYTRILSIQDIRQKKGDSSKLMIMNKRSIKLLFCGLTLREAQCLFYLIRGKSSAAIALRLDISRRTVEDYCNYIKAKFGVDTRSDVIEKAIALGFANVRPEGCELA